MGRVGRVTEPAGPITALAERPSARHAARWKPARVAGVGAGNLRPAPSRTAAGPPAAPDIRRPADTALPRYPAWPRFPRSATDSGVLRMRADGDFRPLGALATVGQHARFMSDKPTPIAHDDKSSDIVVNGRKRQVSTEELTFDELVDLAFDDPARGPQILFTITFRNAAGRFENGELDPGHRLKVQDGTEVDVTRTDQS